MTQARRALIIAPDDFPLGEYDDYGAACRALNLEPNGHCYVVCRVSTAAGPRTLLTVDLGLLQGTEKADASDQASLLSAGRSKETASGTGAGSGRDMLRPPLSGGPRISPLREPSAASGPGQEPNPFGDFCRQERPGGRTAGQPDQPVVQLVLDLDRATLKGVAVWNPRTGQLGIAREAVEAAVREAFADTAAEDVVGKLWPPHAAPPALADFDTVFMALKGVLEPQTLLLTMINVAARVAAAHAGLGVVAPLVGQFAEELCKQYVRPPRERIVKDILYAVDIDLYAAAGKLPECAALRELTLQETSRGIEKLFTAWFSASPAPVDLPSGPEPGTDAPTLTQAQEAAFSKLLDLFPEELQAQIRAKHAKQAEAEPVPQADRGRVDQQAQEEPAADRGPEASGPANKQDEADPPARSRSPLPMEESADKDFELSPEENYRMKYNIQSPSGESPTPPTPGPDHSPDMGPDI